MNFIYGCFIGSIVDAVREVITVQKSSIEPTPEGWLDADHKYFAGIAKLDENLVKRMYRILQTEDIETWSGCLVVASDHKIRVRRP